MRYTYNIVDAQGNKVYADLGTKAEAHEVISILQDQGIDVQQYSIVEEQHYTVKGLGRDPDLH